MITTQALSAAEDTPELARVTLDGAVRGLLARQRPDGSWSGGAGTGISAVTADLLVRDLLGVAVPGRTEAAARLVRSLQCPDGYWPELPGWPADAGASVACYVVLRLAGDPPDAYPMALAAGWIRDAGGLACSDAVTRTWLVLSGLVRGGDPLVSPAGRSAGLTRRARSGPGRSAAADRPTTASLAVAVDRPKTAGRVVADDRQMTAGLAVAADRLISADGLTEAAVSLALTGLGRHGQHRPPLTLDELGSAPRTAAAPGGGVAHELGVRLGRSGCARWLLACQSADGSWARRGPLSALALIALGQAGYEPDHPVLARGLDWLAARAAEATRTCEAELWRRSESAYAAGRETRMIGDAGNAGHVRNLGGIDHSMVTEFLGDANRRGRSNSPDADYFADHDYSAASGPAGSWAAGDGAAGNGADWGRAAGDEAAGLTALAVGSLRLAGLGSGSPALNRAAAFLSRAGVSSGAPVRSVARGRRSSGRGPLALAGSGRGPEVLIAAASVGRMRGAGPLAWRQARHDAVWLLRTQRADGSWPGGRLRGSVQAMSVQAMSVRAMPVRAMPVEATSVEATSVEATSIALHALVAAGMPASKPPIRAAVAWLVGCQATDGGWPARDDAPAESGCRATALAVRALTAAGAAEYATPAECGVRWLAAAQRPDGTWSAPGHDLAATCYAIQALTGYRVLAKALRTGAPRRLDDRSAQWYGYD